MVLGTAKRISEYQYSVKVELWNSDKEGVSEDQKSPLRELWSSETHKSHVRLVLVGFATFIEHLSKVQGVKNTADRQSVKITLSNTYRGNVYPPQQIIEQRVGSHVRKK